MLKSNIFKDELNLIQSENLRESVRDFLDTKVPEYFWEVASSSTGKYHPWYSLGYGGLIRHTKAAVKIADSLLVLEQYSDLPHDEIIAALILHDTFKHGVDNITGYTVFDHPLIAAAQFSNFTVNSDSLINSRAIIYSLISSHMGQWNEQESIRLPKPVSESQRFVHLCDYLASRKFFTVEVE